MNAGLISFCGGSSSQNFEAFGRQRMLAIFYISLSLVYPPGPHQSFGHYAFEGLLKASGPAWDHQEERRRLQSALQEFWRHARESLSQARAIESLLEASFHPKAKKAYPKLSKDSYKDPYKGSLAVSLEGTYLYGAIATIKKAAAALSLC